MEDDPEVRGEGNAYDFGGRSIYDGRVGRFVSVDPRARDFPFMSPYCYAANSPIFYIDLNGEGPIITIHRMEQWERDGTLQVEVEATVVYKIKVINMSSMDIGPEQAAQATKAMQGKANSAYGGTRTGSFTESNRSVDYFGRDIELDEKSFGKDINVKYKVNVKYEYTYVENTSQIALDDDVLVIVDDVKPLPGEEMKNQVGRDFGSYMAVESSYFFVDNTVLLPGGDVNAKGISYDGSNTTVHELGHRLSLGHSTDKENIMYDTESDSWGSLVIRKRKSLNTL